MSEPKEMYQCQTTNCGFIYDPDRGDRKGKIKKGIQFEDLPEDWKCPICGATTKAFKCLGQGVPNLNKKENAMKWLQFLTPAKSTDFKETQEMIASARPDEIIILDVRQPNEYKQSHIPGATLIPLPELSNRLGEIDPEKPVLVY